MRFPYGFSWGSVGGRKKMVVTELAPGELSAVIVATQHYGR